MDDRKDILYIHHSGVFGGASRSLGELIQCMPQEKIRPIVISQKGSASAYFKKLGFTVIEVAGISKFDVTELGHYRRFRWLILLREFYYLVPTLIALFKVKRKYPKIRIVHINDVQDFLWAYFVKSFFKVPVVLHIRGPLMKRRGLRFRFLMKSLKNTTNQVVAIDETVRKTIEKNLDVEIVHNGLIVPYDSAQKTESRSELIIGMVSNMFRFKGVLDFVEAARICREKNANLKFEILGGKNELSKGIINNILEFLGLLHNVEKDVYSKIETYELDSSLRVLAFSKNIDIFYRRISILCFPSHINAVGRPVFEAGFYNVPSIVAITDPQQDAIIHMETGICIQPKNPRELASAILYFYERPAEIERMGRNAFNLSSEMYDIKRNSEKLINIYDRLLGCSKLS